jgi:hypothetical protein
MSPLSCIMQNIIGSEVSTPGQDRPKRKIAKIGHESEKIDALKFDYSAFEEPPAILTLGIFDPPFTTRFGV